MCLAAYWATTVTGSGRRYPELARKRASRGERVLHLVLGTDPLNPAPCPRGSDPALSGLGIAPSSYGFGAMRPEAEVNTPPMYLR
jgi:hypothetical protein